MAHSAVVKPAPKPPTLPPAPGPIDCALAAIPPDWVQWIAEQRLRECAPESMVHTMVSAGHDAGLAAQAIAEAESDPVMLAARRMQQIQRKLESVVANLQLMWELDPHYAEVERIAEPPLEDFLRRYVVGCRPVVLTGVAADWPALARWSPADLKSRFGHIDVEVQAERDANPLYEQEKLEHRRQVRLADFVDQVLAGGANNEMLRRPEFAPLLADIGTLPRLCDRAALLERSSFWFGPAGTVTPLHHDTIMLFHTQIVGRKRWRFVSPLQTPRLYNHHNVFSAVNLDAPDLVRHPDFAGVKVLEVVAGPGDTVFLPLGWWHQVSSLDVSLSFSYSNLALPNAYTYRHPDIRNW
jgi:Cupin-like domain